MMKLTAVQKTALLLFLGLSASYVCLSPGSIAGQGYTAEDIDSGLRLLSVGTAWIKGQSVPPMIWSRHGPVPVVLDLPFLKLGKLVISPDFFLSFQPALLTAGLVTLLFLWLRKLCPPGISLFLSLTAAFGTMLWPYAYIGLETKQSFLLFLAGYLALAGGKPRSWPHVLFFATVCGLAISVKSTGIIMWPVIAFLVYAQSGDDWRAQRGKLLTSALIVGTIWAIGHWGINRYWIPRGGGTASFRVWLIDSPLLIFSNTIGVFGSPTKGLFVYAPILIASLYAVPRTFGSHRRVAVFAILITICNMALLSILTDPTADGWGPRYMHVVIAPLMLCIGAACTQSNWRAVLSLVLLAVIGACISFLGAFYYYGQRDFAAAKAGQNTLEWLTGDAVWNPIGFHARLLRVWLSDNGSTPVLWTPKHIWVWTPPPDAQPWKSIDLREYCQPQSFLVRFWHVPKQGTAFKIFTLYLTCLILGVLLLAWVVVRTIRDQRDVAALVGAPEATEVRTA
jgi:hypothetical protein